MTPSKVRISEAVLEEQTGDEGSDEETPTKLKSYLKRRASKQTESILD